MRKQAEAGVDIVNDGEMSKPSYATYIKDRLAGFGGTGNTFVYQDLADFPNLAKRVFGDPGRSRRKTPACNAPIACATPQAAQADVDNLKAALATVERSTEAFMSAASPGVMSLFFRNDHYPQRGSLSVRDRRGDAARIRGGRQAPASCCRSIAPISRWAGTSSTPSSTSPSSASRRALHVEALNHALAQHPAGAAAHASVLGQLRGPAPLRRAARRHHRHRVHARGRARSRSRPPIRATRTNGRCSRTSSCPTARC